MATEYIETFSFKLNMGSSRQKLLEGFTQSNQWLEQNPAFIYRSLAHNTETDSWQDVLYWRSADAAKQAGDDFFTETLNQKFIQQVNTASLVVTQHAVQGEFYTNESCE